MSENNSDDSGGKSNGSTAKPNQGRDTTDKLDAKTAYREYHENGLTYAQIGEKYGVSTSTASRREKEYEEISTEKEKEIQQNPQKYGLKHESEDKETENPYKTQCPACNSKIPKPNSAGIHECPECETNLQFTEDEI